MFGCLVRNHQANSHANKGWEQFTDAVIKTISEKKKGVVFLLWGNSAQAKSRYFHSSRFILLRWAFLIVVKYAAFTFLSRKMKWPNKKGSTLLPPFLCLCFCPSPWDSGLIFVSNAFYFCLHILGQEILTRNLCSYRVQIFDLPSLVLKTNSGISVRVILNLVLKSGIILRI